MNTSGEQRGLHEQISVVAALDPDRPSLGTIQGDWLTRAAVNTAWRSIATALTGRGIRHGDAVAVVLPNGIAMALAFLGSSAAGVCAPLNPNLAPQEFDFYLDDLGARAAIVLAGTDHPVRAIAQQRGVTLLELVCAPESPAEPESQPAPDRGDANKSSEPEPKLARDTFQITGSRLPFAPTPPKFASNIGLVLHTSGTTARPKIVPLTHENLAASARNIATTLELSNADRCGNIMPLFHIHGIMAALAAPLTAGSSVVCSPGFGAPEVLRWFEQQRVTYTTAVPTMLQSIVAQARLHPEHVPQPALRFVRSSSAALPPTVMRELQSLLHTKVVEAYGMTEAAHQMCSNPLVAGAQVEGSVGLAAGPQVAIMDAGGALLPADTIGEIVIRGDNVMTGYASDDPAINEWAFTDGWFRTGDQGTIDAGGYVRLTARLKEIINRGGEKIAPREVDEVLLQHPGVAQALCFAVPDSRLGEQIAAIVVLATATNPATGVPTEGDLREFVAERLAAFKVPRRVVIATQIPTGPTGKLQRIGLAERLGLHDLEMSACELDPTAPGNAVEELVHGWWSELLGIETISIHSHFLDVGGDSLLAAKLLGRVTSELGIAISMITFFDAATIAAQSALIAVDLLASE